MLKIPSKYNPPNTVPYCTLTMEEIEGILMARLKDAIAISPSRGFGLKEFHSLCGTLMVRPAEEFVKICFERLIGIGKIRKASIGDDYIPSSF